MKKNSRLLRELKSFGFWLLGGMLVGLFGGIILRILTYLRFDFMTINWLWLLKIGIYSLLALVLSTNLVTGLMMVKIKKELPLLKNHFLMIMMKGSASSILDYLMSSYGKISAWLFYFLFYVCRRFMLGIKCTGF
ncbi:hypothetical protein [Streptococcus pluranimalium]